MLRPEVPGSRPERTSFRLREIMPTLTVITSSMVGDGFWLEEWLVQPRLGRIVRGRVVVDLRPRVMDVLVVLAKRVGDVVSKRELVDSVWQSGFIADNTINHCIKELREQLGDSTSPPRFVQTIPRRGYRLVGCVRAVSPDDLKLGIEAARCVLEAARWNAFLLVGDNLIGRGGEAHIVIESPRVSRHHARITVTDAGVIVEDLGSKNGTFVGDRRIDRPTPLADGDELGIGDVQLVFHARGCDDHDATLTM